MSVIESIGTKTRLTLCAGVGALSLIVAAPAVAQDQTTTVNQSCSSSTTNGTTTTSGDCGSGSGQDRVVQQGNPSSGNTSQATVNSVTASEASPRVVHVRDYRPRTVYRYRCSDGTIVRDSSSCPSTAVRYVSSYPRGGVETGGGGTLAHPSTVADVAKLAGPPLALFLILGGVLGLRRTRLS